MATEYTISRTLRLHTDLLVRVAELARRNGLSVPKQVVKLLEEGAENYRPGDYELHHLTEVYGLTRNPRRKDSGNQLHLYLKPQTEEALEALAEAQDCPLRELRLSLILSRLEELGRL